MLRLLWALAQDTNKFVTPALSTLQLHSNEATELLLLARSEKRYEWRKVGEALHLFPSHEKNGRSVAVVVKDSKLFKVTISAPGRRTLSGSASTLTKAKKLVEDEFQMHDEG